MRILLINDASNNGHYGCSAVANALRLSLSERNSAQIYPIFNRQLEKDGSHSRFVDSQISWFSALLKWCDLVVINGEGTLHHGRAPELEVAMHCALEAKRPYFVVNSIFEDYPRLVPLLKQAAGVSLRDSLSLKEARDNSVSAEPCCDATLFAAFVPYRAPKTRIGTATTDWHGKAPDITHTEMSRRLNETHAIFLPFKSPAAARHWPHIVNRLAQFERVVSGRYHGTLFSIMAGTPVMMFPSNSHKVAALALEFGMHEHHHGQASASSYSLEGQDLDRARHQLIDKRSSRHLHPLHVLELRSKVHAATDRRAAYPFGSSAFGDGSASQHESARLIADEMKLRTPPLPRKQRRQLMQRLKVSAGTLRDISAFLLQEGFPEQNIYVKDALLSAGDEQAAFEVALRSFRARPSSATLRISLAAILARRGDYCGAHALFKSLDNENLAAGQLARLAARSANRVGDYVAAFRYVAAAVDEKKPESLVRAAAAASRAGDTEAAKALAGRAYENAHLLREWPAKNTGNILAANGLLSQGLECMANALRRYDSTFAHLSARCTHSNIGTAVYFPAMFGVGSAMLALTMMAAMIERLPAPMTLIIDPRLESPARALLGSHITCASADKIDSVEPIGRVETAFDILRDLTVDGVMPKWQGTLVPCKRRTEDVSAELRRRFRDKMLCGLTWFTPNARTGSGRNISLGELRSLVSAFPDIQFVSLQPDNQAAEFDLQQVAAQNVYIETAVDPIADIDGQLCLIASLDRVIGIDSSAIHFAGALGKEGVVLLTGEPTWQWPLRSSPYASITTTRTLNELGKVLGMREQHIIAH